MENYRIEQFVSGMGWTPVCGGIRAASPKEAIKAAIKRYEDILRDNTEEKIYFRAVIE